MANVAHLKVFLCVIYFFTETAKGQKECGDLTSAKEYTFLGPSTFMPKCTLRVHVPNSKVTHLRLDFKTFSIAPPEKMLTDFGSYQCLRDSFTVESLPRNYSSDVPRKLLFEKLCGEKSGQHIHVPVNAVQAPDTIQLTFDLRQPDEDAKSQMWSIKITQLDCNDIYDKDLCAPLVKRNSSNQMCGTQIGTPYQKYGVCKSWDDCMAGSGTSLGPCGSNEEVCCKYVYTCGNSTSEKLSYFKNPAVVPSLCSFRINVYDERVTQIRLDFITFNLAQPTKPSNSESIEAYFCRNDSFTVQTSSAISSNLGFQNLCGSNTGQHIYVPVNATLGPAAVDLYFMTANRANYPGLPNPEWNIKITQIDCCAPETKDFCAPAGCLQYYPEPSGSFESFNYNGGAGHYQGLLNYVICFKRYDIVCSMQYNAIGFQLATNNFDQEYGNAGCNLPTTDVTNPLSRDYLFIPDATAANGIE